MRVLSALTAVFVVAAVFPLPAPAQLGTGLGEWQDLPPGRPLSAEEENGLYVSRALSFEGTLWCVGVLSNKKHLCYWKDGAWIALHLLSPDPTKMFIDRIAPGPDNSLLVRWDCHASTCAGAQIRGGRHRLLIAPQQQWHQFFGDKETVIWRDGADGVWCPEFWPLVDHFREDGWRELAVIPVESPLWAELRQRAVTEEERATLHTDPLDRVWLASRGAWGGRCPLQIIDPRYSDTRKVAQQDSDWGRAFQIVDVNGEVLQEGAPSPGTYARDRLRTISLIHNPESGALWVLLDGKQVWEVNPETCGGTLVAEAGVDGPSEIQQVLFEGGRTWCVSTDGYWRLEGGAFTRVMGPFSSAVRYQLAHANGGAWLTSMGDVWFLPDDGGAPRVVDEQSGYFLGASVGFNTLPGNAGVIAFGFQGKPVLLPDPSILPLKPLRSSPDQGSVGQIPPEPETGAPGCAWAEFNCGPLLAANGNIYGFTWDRPKELARWDGQTWTWKALDPDIGDGDPLSDNAGNIWVINGLKGDTELRLSRFLAEEERFETDTLDGWAGRLQPGWLVFNSFTTQILSRLPLVRADGRILQLARGELRLYADGKWHSWSAKDIMKVSSNPLEQPPPDEFPQTTRAFFSPGGEVVLHPSVAMPRVLKNGQWIVPTPYDPMLQYAGSPPAMEGGPLSGQEGRKRATLKDSLMLREGKVRRILNGEWREVFGGRVIPTLGINPRAELEPVLCAGDYPVFFTGKSVLVVLEPPYPAPEAVAEIVDGNHIMLSVSNQPGNAPLHWRMSDKWQSAEETGLVIGPLPNGKHTVWCRFVDEGLRSGPVTGLNVEIVTNADSMEQWLLAVADPSSGGAEAAQASLMAMGREALPHLAAAGAAAPPDQALRLRRLALRIDADFITAPYSPLVERLPEPPTSARTPAAAVSAAPLQRDNAGYVWRAYNNGENRVDLMVWTGARWATVCPGLECGLYGFAMAFDSIGRIWVSSKNRESQAIVGEPLTDNRFGDRAWKKYFSLQDALDARLTADTVFAPGPLLPGSFQNTNRRAWGLHGLLRMQDGGLAYHEDNRVAARLGGAWKEWSLAEVLGIPGSEQRVAAWRLNGEGMPEIGTNEASARLVATASPVKWDAAGQALMPEDECFCTETRELCPAPPDTPPLVNADLLEKKIQARIALGDGTAWHYGAQGLFREGYGLRRLIATADKLPVVVGVYGPEDIVQSPCGMVFISALRQRTATWDFHGAMGMELHDIPPDTAAALEGNGDGTLTLRFNPPPGTRPFHTWRVDGGPWLCATDKPEATLGPLAPGTHWVEVRAVTEWVVPDPEPLVLKGDVVLAPELVGQWLDALIGGNPAARERAARSLVVLGGEMLPRLEALRERAPDNEARWWVDTVIQQIHRSMANQSETSVVGGENRSVTGG